MELQRIKQTLDECIEDKEQEQISLYSTYSDKINKVRSLNGLDKITTEIQKVISDAPDGTISERDTKQTEALIVEKRKSLEEKEKGNTVNDVVSPQNVIDAITKITSKEEMEGFEKWFNENKIKEKLSDEEKTLIATLWKEKTQVLYT